MIDPYLDPISGVLINKLGITNQQELDEAEANCVSVRSVLLQRNPVQGNFDTPHLKAIHSYLFQDVYPFAGETRSIDLHKADVVSGGRRLTSFTAPDRIEEELKSLFERLAEDNFFQGLGRNEFASQLANLFSSINKIHPFREGNGRAQRQFVRQLAEGLGFNMHWEAVSKERLVQASITSAHGDLSMMQRLMDEITDTARIQPILKVIEFFERQEYNWNDRYLASATPGQHYEGVFAGSDGSSFYFRDYQERILVGSVKDLGQNPNQGDTISFTAS